MALAVAAILLAGGAWYAVGASEPADPPRLAVLPPAVPLAFDSTEVYDHLVAQAVVAEVPVHAEPGGIEPVHRLSNPTEFGGPLVFLVSDNTRDDWVRVMLPVRPNGSQGWIRRSDIRIGGTNYRLEVSLSDHRLELFDGDRSVFHAVVGIGTEDTPTPGGTFYLKELLAPPDPNGPYGTYAYGLSGFSNTLEEFAGGEGVVGIHGTNDPSLVGQDVSHGCIRMTNEDIAELVDVLPLGVPVEILA